MTNLGTIYLVDKELLSLHCKLYIIELNQQKKNTSKFMLASVEEAK